MKRILFILLVSLLVVTGCSNDIAKEDVNTDDPVSMEKKDEMLDSAIKMYLNNMTMNFSSAFTIAVTHEDKMKYLNDAITDINLSVLEIEEKYTRNTPPTEELLELADILLITIEHEMLGETESAYDSARDAGVIIGELSRKHLDGELPIGIKLMTGKENTNN